MIGTNDINKRMQGLETSVLMDAGVNTGSPINAGVSRSAFIRSFTACTIYKIKVDYCIALPVRLQI